MAEYDAPSLRTLYEIAVKLAAEVERHTALLEQIARDTAEIRRLANGGEKRP